MLAARSFPCRPANGQGRMHDPVFEPPFTIHEPVRLATPLVVSVPHAGRHYPDAFLAQSRLNALALRRSEDAFMDDLMAGAVGLGAPLLAARFPRAFLDVNREPYEIDPRLFHERPPAYANTRSLRVAGGLGTIPRVVGDGQEIYRSRLPLAEGLARIEWLHRPYHHALRQLMARARRDFGVAILLDCHSMPSAGLPVEGGRRPDIVLGDRFGTSCAPELVERIETVLRGQGFHVTRNRPYAGGYITEHHGAPSVGCHALQIEVARSLYMNERTLEPHEGFTDLRDSLTELVRQVVAHAGDDFSSRPLAAE